MITGTYIPPKFIPFPDNTSNNSIPVKTSTSWENSGVEIQDGLVVAPEGFKVKSGGFSFGDSIGITESSGILVVQNKIKNKQYQVVDYYSPKDASTNNPKYFKLSGPEYNIVAQPIQEYGIEGPCSVEYECLSLVRINSIVVVGNNHLSYVSARVTDLDTGNVIKYFPTKSEWESGTGGPKTGPWEVTLDLKDSPMVLNQGTRIRIDFYGSQEYFTLAGNQDGVPYLAFNLQDGVFEELVDYSQLSQIIGELPQSFSGNYNDLSNKPLIPTDNSELSNGSGFITASEATSQSPVQSVAGRTGTILLSVSDVSGLPAVAVSGSYSDLTGRPSLSAVSASGNYNDLTNKPTIPSAQVNSDWTAVSGVSQVLNKPNLATVATSGSYADLTNKPTIPSVNYPVTSVNTKVGSVVLTSSDVGAAASVHTHAISDVTGLQTTLDSKASTVSLSGYATTGALTTATTGLRKVETFLGTTDASGNFTITFANTYTTPPDVQPQIIGGTFNQSVRVVSVSNTGCVVQAAQRNLVTLLSVEVLLGATVNLVGASVTVQVTPRT